MALGSSNNVSNSANERKRATTGYTLKIIANLQTRKKAVIAHKHKSDLIVGQ